MRYLDKLDSQQRKEHPVASGVMDYFPDALAMVAHVSWVGNQKHNAEEDLHWARGKSSDEDDALMRHFLTRDDTDWYMLPNGREIAIPHRALVAWRALASLQKWMEEQYHLHLPKGARHE